jgi:hypothetical protein
MQSAPSSSTTEPALTGSLSPASLLQASRLETARSTLLFWVTTAIYSGSFLLVRFPPCVDYPQHLALATLLGRLLDPAAAEHAIYEPALLSYNGLFHVIVALLSRLIPAEWAGRLVLSLVPVLLASAGLSWMRYSRRPLWYAALFLPMSYSFAAGWGFVNYSLAVPIALLTLVSWLRHVSGERGLVFGIVIGSLLVAYAHGMTLLAFYLSAALAFAARTTLGEAGPRRWFLAARRGALPLLPAAVYALVVFRYHLSAPHLGLEPERDGQDFPAWFKLAGFLRLSVGNLADRSDTWLCAGVLLTAMATVVLAYSGRSRPPSAPRECRVLFGFWILLYLALPQTLFSTGFIFERAPIWIWIFGLSSLPLVRAPRLSALALGLSWLSSVNTARAFASIPDVEAAARILERIPAGQRLLALTHEPRALPVIERPIWVHLSAYYLLQSRGGEIAFDFTRYASLPLRLKSPSATSPQPRPRLPSGVEWDPAGYSASDAYARYYDTVLVVLGRQQQPLSELQPLLATEDPLLLAAEGRFRLYQRRGPDKAPAQN